MGTMKYKGCALLGIASALMSCAAPKAIVVAEATAPKKELKEEKSEAPVVPEPTLPAAPEDGLRMPDMLAMPGDGDFRSSNPVAPKTGRSGAVISRPPTDPPSRVKPKAD